jgi:hypothetical protein
MQCTTIAASQAPRHLPPTNPEGDQPMLALGMVSSDNANTAALPPWLNVRHGFTSSHCSLDPLLTRWLVGATWATCRLSTSATETIPRHTFESTKPQSKNSKPLIDFGWRYSLRSAVSRVFPAQGLCSTELHNNHHSDRSPPWLYPNLFDSGTSCRELMPSVIRKKLTLSDRAVSRSLAN